MQTEIPLQIAQDSIEIGITYESDMTVTYRPVSQKAENSPVLLLWVSHKFNGEVNKVEGEIEDRKKYKRFQLHVRLTDNILQPWSKFRCFSVNLKGRHKTKAIYNMEAQPNLSYLLRKGKPPKRNLTPPNSIKCGTKLKFAPFSPRHHQRNKKKNGGRREERRTSRCRWRGWAIG